MIKQNILLAALLFLSAFSFAQKQSQPNKEEIESQRIAFITQQLQLTPEQAQAFWPLYNQYKKELDDLKKNRSNDLGPKTDIDSLSDADANKLIDNELATRQKELDITRKYNSEFKKVLPVNKVARLYGAEQQFKLQLIKQYRSEKSGGAPSSSPAQGGQRPPVNQSPTPHKPGATASPGQAPGGQRPPPKQAPTSPKQAPTPHR